MIIAPNGSGQIPIGSTSRRNLGLRFWRRSSESGCGRTLNARVREHTAGNHAVEACSPWLGFSAPTDWEIPMKKQPSLPAGIWSGAWVTVRERATGAMRLSKSMIAVVATSVLLAACAGTGQESVADATTTKQPIKAKATHANARKASGDRITTSSLRHAPTEKIANLPYRPAVGSRWIGTIEVRETQTKNSQIIESTVVRERGEYRIARKLDKGYHINYTINHGSFEGNTPLTGLMAPLIESMKGQSLTFETDEAGIPVRIPDVAKLKAVMIKAIDIVAQSKPEFASVPQMKQFIEGLRAQYEGATEETGVTLFLAELLNYSTVQGLTNMPIGQEQSYDDEVVNPIIGAKMRAKGSFKIAAVDKATGLATIEWRQTILPEDLNKATLEFVKRILPNAEQGSKDFLDTMAQLKIDHVDQAVYKISVGDGVVRRMDKTTVIKTQGSEKKTVVIMTMDPATTAARNERS